MATEEVGVAGTVSMVPSRQEVTRCHVVRRAVGVASERVPSYRIFGAEQAQMTSRALPGCAAAGGWGSFEGAWPRCAGHVPGPRRPLPPPPF